MKTLFLSMVALLLAASSGLNAQSKEEQGYRKASEALRKQVWAWDRPEFKVREVPAQYANASKVILAQHTELTGDSKSKFQFYVVTFNVKRDQSLTEVVREMVKVNDKTAVSNYSELSFTQFKKSSGFYTSAKSTTYVGVRVIKPDGKVKEIDADDIVLTKDAKTEKTAKVAIPDLQPGDILDYFIATDQSLTNDISRKPYTVLLFDDAPVLHRSFHAQLGKKYAIEYRSYNGAPELSVNKNDDKDIIVDVEKKNIPPFETSLFVAPGLQLPFIRMNIALGYKGVGSKYLGVQKPGEVSRNTSSEEFLEHKAGDFSEQYYNGYWFKAAKSEFDAIVSDAKKKAKQSGIDYKSLNDVEKAAYLYYTLRYTKLLNFDIDKLKDKIYGGYSKYNGLSFAFYCLFKSADLKPAILITNDRKGVRFSEIMDVDDLESTACLTGINKLFSLKTIYDIPFAAPAPIEGASHTKSFTFNHPAVVGGKIRKLTRIEDGFKVPVSSSKDNAHIEQLQMALVPGSSDLSINRSTTLKGFYKVNPQSNLILYEDFYESERKLFHDRKTLIEQLEDGRKSKKYVDEVKSAFAEARKKQKEAFETEAGEWFEQEVKDLKDYKIDNLGVRHTAPDFVYSSSFKLSGMVKKAGNNYIVEIGKIQGQPLVVEKDQRKRDLDVYMSFARSTEYHINMQIPEGYTAEGVSALNKSVKNDAGFFTVEASATDKLITIVVKKHYLHNFEPAQNWDKLVAFTDASSEWVNAKLLFRKK
jgi:hypothetical protein